MSADKTGRQKPTSGARHCSLSRSIVIGEVCQVNSAGCSQAHDFSGKYATTSILLRFTLIHPPPQAGVPASNAPEKKFNSRLVAPTIFQKEPFGEHVEELSHFADGSCSFKIVFK